MAIAAAGATAATAGRRSRGCTTTIATPIHNAKNIAVVGCAAAATATARTAMADRPRRNAASAATPIANASIRGWNDPSSVLTPVRAMRWRSVHARSRAVTAHVDR